MNNIKLIPGKLYKTYVEIENTYLVSVANIYVPYKNKKKILYRSVCHILLCDYVIYLGRNKKNNRYKHKVLYKNKVGYVLDFVQFEQL